MLYYERLLASRKKAPVRREARRKLAEVQPEQFIRDPYVLDFLDLKDYPALRESAVEQALRAESYLPDHGLATAIFPARRKGETNRGSVQRHVRMLTRRLDHLGVPVTFDIFGLTAEATGDLGIGQVWEDFTSVADVVLPMVYPSHYYRGAYGLERPNAHPYLVVRRALEQAIERTRAGGGAARIRPYLQAFTLGRRLPRYTPHEIREQIRAAEELGLTSWVLWNPRSVYQRDSLRPYRASQVRAASW